MPQSHYNTEEVGKGFNTMKVIICGLSESLSPGGMKYNIGLLLGFENA